MVKVNVAATPSPTKTKPSPRMTRSMRKKQNPSKSPAAKSVSPVKKSTVKKVNKDTKKPLATEEGCSPEIKSKLAKKLPTTPANKPVTLPRVDANGGSPQVKSKAVTPQMQAKSPKIILTPVSAKQHEVTPNIQNLSSPRRKFKQTPKPITPKPEIKSTNIATPVSSKKIDVTPNIQSVSSPQLKSKQTPKPATPQIQAKSPKIPSTPASAKKIDVIPNMKNAASPQVKQKQSPKAPTVPVLAAKSPEKTPVPVINDAVPTPNSSAKKRKRKNKKAKENAGEIPQDTVAIASPFSPKKLQVEVPPLPSTPKAETKQKLTGEPNTPQSAGKAKKNKKKKNKKLEEKVSAEGNPAENSPPAAAEENKKGKPTLDKEKVLKGIETLKVVLEKKAEKKNVLFGEDPLPIFMQVASIKISKDSHKTIRMSLPHPINKARTDSAVLLVVKDLEKGLRTDHEATLLHYQQLLKKTRINRVTEVMPFRQLRAEYFAYEAKGKLAKRFDTFLVDDRVAPSVSVVLGQQFFKTGKVCLPVDMTAKKLKKEIDEAIDMTYLHLSNEGNCSQIQVGLSSQPTEEIAANIMAVANVVAKKFPGGIVNIRSLVIRTPDSIAVPLFYSFVSRNCIRLKKRVVNKREYVDEVTTLDLGQKVRVNEDGEIQVFRDPKYVPGAVDKDLLGLSDQEDQDEDEESMDEGSVASSEEQNEQDPDLMIEKHKTKKQTIGKENGVPVKKIEDESSEDEDADEAEREYLKRIHGDDEGEDDVAEENEMESEAEHQSEDESEQEDWPVNKVVKKNKKGSKPVKGKGKK